MRYEKLVHPMEIYTGIKTFKIEQRPLTKDNLYGCVEFPKSLLTIDPNQWERVYYYCNLKHDSAISWTQ